MQNVFSHIIFAILIFDILFVTQLRDRETGQESTFNSSALAFINKSGDIFPLIRSVY